MLIGFYRDMQPSAPFHLYNISKLKINCVISLVWSTVL